MRPVPALVSLAMVAAVSAVVLGACSKNPLKIRRSACPAVAVVRNAGTLTLFQPETSRDADAIDVSAQISSATGPCNQRSSQLVTPVRVEISAVRTRASGSRDVTLPLFAAVVRQNDTVVARQTRMVTLHFDDGVVRASALATLTATLDRAQAEKLLPPPPANDEEAARKVQPSPYEVLVGFQLTDDQAAYNVGR